MLSVVILTKNEEKNISNCIKSVSWCDEIIVVDDNSTDKTCEIVDKTKSKLIIRPLNNNFSQIRNYGLSRAKGDWVMFIDADERVTPLLQKEIIEKIKQNKNNYAGFLLKRNDFLMGKMLKHGETKNIRLLRIAKKDSGEWLGAVHEEWEIKGKTGELKNPLVHYPHQSIVEFLQEINFYSDLRAKELFVQGEKVDWMSIVCYPLGKFIFNYFYKLGFLDGMQGLIFAIIMCFHSFLVRGKLWLYWQKKPQQL